MKVTLRPLVARDSQWAGVVKYKNCYEDIKTYFTRSGQLYTGLIPDEAKRLGEKLNLDLNIGSEFWRDFFIKTTGKDMILDLEDPMDELRYLFLKNHKRVKDSIFAHKATANFVLINEEEEAKKTNLFNRTKRDAIIGFSKMTPEDMRKALRIFGKSAENVSPEVVENKLSEIVEGNPQGFMDKWVNNNKRDIQYIVERAISLNVIRKNKRIYMYGADTIGHGLEDTVNYLEDSKNQDVRFAIEQGIAGKASIDTPILIKSEDPSLKKQPTHQLSMKPVAEVKAELAKASPSKKK